MCGIVGMAGNLQFKDEATMQRMLMFDYFRGKDSTGFASIGLNNEARIAKIASHPLDLFEMKPFQNALKGSASYAFIGHNRATTRGATTTFNAHPFHYGDIIGVHNGTLNHQSFEKLQELAGEKFNVDSQAIFACIDRVGIKETMKEMSGAWSLVWYDQADKTLNFLRNKERPMWFAWSEAIDKIFWASEYPMISASLALTTTEYKLYSDPQEGYKFWPTEINKLYSIDLKELAKGHKEIPDFIVAELPGKEPAPVAKHDPFERGGWSGMGYGSSITQTQTQTQTSKTTTSPGTTSQGTHTCGATEEDDNKTLEFLRIVSDSNHPYGDTITQARFEEIARDGCSFCSADIEYGDQDISIFERDDVILCADCSGVKDSRVYLPNLAAVV